MPIDEDDDESSEDEQMFCQNEKVMNYAELESKQELRGKDGELDWRMLTKEEKKSYMKTKVIKDYYDELR